MPAPNRLRYCWVADALQVLVPKKRGFGFLRVPYGHHPIPGLNEVAELAGCDVFGLDGALCFENRGAFHGPSEGRKAFEAIVIPALERHYGYASAPATVEEFWALHPLSVDVRALANTAAQMEV